MLFFQAFDGIEDALIVKTHSVDNGMILFQAEQSFFGVSFLGFRGQRSDFHKTESEIGKFVVEFGILVKAGCQSHWIFKADAENLTLQTLILQSIHPSKNTRKTDIRKKMDKRKSKVMGTLRIE